MINITTLTFIYISYTLKGASITMADPGLLLRKQCNTQTSNESSGTWKNNDIIKHRDHANCKGKSKSTSCLFCACCNSDPSNNTEPTHITAFTEFFSSFHVKGACMSSKDKYPQSFPSFEHGKWLHSEYMTNQPIFNWLVTAAGLSKQIITIP